MESPNKKRKIRVVSKKNILIYKLLDSSGSMDPYKYVTIDSVNKFMKDLHSNSNEFNSELEIDPTIIAQKVCSELYDGVTTSELDILSSEISIALYSKHLDYSTLASRIIISNHHKKTNDVFSDVIETLYENDIITKYLFEMVQLNKQAINDKIDYSRDYKLDFFGFKTLEKSYLLKCNGKSINSFLNKIRL